ncbi:MAG: SpoIIE family protein phosphatase, partial [Alphaproteobacteria bacterium]
MLHKFSSQVTKPLHDSRILIIDDISPNCELIIEHLQKDGFRFIATNSNEELEPDIVIIDVGMLETLEELREDPLFNKVPVLTIVGNHEERSKAWEAGTSDILSKPIDQQELLSRIKAQLTNTYQKAELEYYYKNTQDDVDQSFELQHLLLPTDETILLYEKKHNISIHSLFIPSRFLSGDLCGLIDISDHKLGVWISDFSGKGIRAALNTFRLHTLIQDYQYCADDPDEFIDALNTRLIELMPVGQFATFLIGVIDFQNNVFEYTAAGATHPLVYYPD